MSYIVLAIYSTLQVILRLVRLLSTFYPTHHSSIVLHQSIYNMTWTFQQMVTPLAGCILSYWITTLIEHYNLFGAPIISLEQTVRCSLLAGVPNVRYQYVTHSYMCEYIGA